MIRVLIADDEALIRTGLRMILESAEDIEVVGEAEDGAAALAAITLHLPDVVLMDVRMPRIDGLEATRRARDLQHRPNIIVLTTFDLDDYVYQALQAGATGFLLKDTPPHDLVQAVRVIASGEAMLSPAVTRRVISQFASPSTSRQEQAKQQIAGVTQREREVLTAVGRGMSNADIGRQLFMSEATVKAHVSRVLTKLGADNRVQVAIIAHNAGLLQD